VAYSRKKRWLDVQSRGARDTIRWRNVASPAKLKGAVHRAESQCAGHGGDRERKDRGGKKKEKKGKCVDEGEQRARGIL
jgi:hypothetical protein